MGILEKRVSRTVERKWLTDSMAWSCLCVQSLRFLSLGTSEVYCLCHRRHKTSGNSNSQYRIDLRCFELHLEFSNDLGCHLSRRIMSCVEAQGGHFEHLL
jgi:hypothetical protein